MESERLKIFDEDGNPIGVATREEVHARGLWHETFHCWFMAKEDDTHYLYLQIRSEQKKDYPNLLDITAAGHLLVNETVQDGVREVYEETGIAVSFEVLKPLGIMKYSVTREKLIDQERAHVFLYQDGITFTDFRLQREEVAGMVRVRFADFYMFCLRKKEEVVIEGFKQNESGEKMPVLEKVGWEHFVPHEPSFYEEVVNRIDKAIKS